ncbi:right-handed parallel beta-helix repeat-containing protein [Hymenobacter sp. ASUV-10]|uniref:Right-handed parallel beta-helix repeat-containing protein n=1 Tax=Hymenobacter aranciens TaxID=3063996 RepID=A0ABT9B5H8_9BACT|nr:right-handed parallel beta-helix repeat-containing protein [Hymenobacter sp. ASUV-10]MDO7873514.1 right-handed parallel beta-helix repeat-containing protein [Hymenobacter sp. ASUV-10]
MTNAYLLKLPRLTLLLALLLWGLGAHATVYYVDAGRADNTGNGRSWATAKKDVQEAINLATAAGDEVWVKAGTYLPTLVPPGTAPSTSAPDRTVYLINTDIKLYGGFAGTETAASQRSPATNLTILSGDLPGTTDAKHVLLTIGRSSACLVDGFTVRGGQALSGASPSVQPTSGAAVMVTNVHGGGMNNSSSSPTVSNCTFSGNTAYSGGGMSNTTGSNPVVRNCAFSGNTAVNTGAAGAGMFNTNSNVTVTDCTFSGNTVTGNGNGGGGMCNANSGTAVVSNCLFSGNTAPSGGGMTTSRFTGLTVTNCTFSNNAAVGSSTFSSSGVGGGMLTNNLAAAVVTVSNCVFSGNAAFSGGAMYNTSSVTVSSCTFSGNTATLTTGLGGGLYYAAGGGGTLTNCILYQNTTPSNAANPNREELYKAGTTVALTVSNCIVRDAAGTTPALTVANAALSSCYTSAPGYVDPADPDGPDNTWATADDGLRLDCASFAVDKGTGSTPATDLLGNPRKGLMDLGAYEATGGTAPANAIPAATTTVSGTQTAAPLPYTDCQSQLLLLDATLPYTLRGSTVATVQVLAAAPTFNRQPYVRRFYDIAPVANAATATAEVTLYFTQADFDDYNAARGSYPALPLSAADPEGYAANLRITQKHGRSATGTPGSYTGWAGSGPATVFITAPAVAYNASAARWEVRFPVTGFSGFFAHTGPSPLPVELMAFTATAAGPAAVRLAWATASERNSARFEVERSTDGRHFGRIGTVAAAGRSSSARTYELPDPNPPVHQSTLYYRLRLVDADGTFSYSPVRAVARPGAATGLRMFPNPATTGATTLTGAAPGTVVTVLDALGRPVATATADAAGTATLALPAGQPAGVYVVRAGRQVLRLVVE